VKYLFVKAARADQGDFPTAAVSAADAHALPAVKDVDLRQAGTAARTVKPGKTSGSGSTPG